MAASAREVALQCLNAWEKQGAWPDGYLPAALRRAGLESRDAGLCTRLAYGVLQNRMLLDWHLARFSTMEVEKMEPPVRNALRLGLYQLLFLDRVPVHAAVHQSVALAKAHSANPRAAGLVNAVLRSAARAREEGLPQPEELPVRYSHPDWLVKEFSHTLPAGEVEALLACNNAPVPTVAQVNTLKTTAGALGEELLRAGVAATPHPWLPNCLELADTGDLEALDAFQKGHFYIQDAAARLAVLAAWPRPGMAVLDACAAPGGKSFAAAMEMEGQGEILACDIHANKLKRIREGAARLGISQLTVRCQDAKSFVEDWEGRFDLVIADVPCSGLGIIRKKPDIRYKDPKPLEGLPRVQLAILENVSRYVRPGGRLLYATCTLLERENEGVVEAFLARHRQFRLSPFRLPGREESAMCTLWPHRDGTDGFFFARLERQSVPKDGPAPAEGRDPISPEVSA